MGFSLTLLSFLALLTATWALPTPRSNAISVRETFDTRASLSNNLELDIRDLEGELERRANGFTFFAGLPNPVNAPQPANGGLPAGAYRIASINTASNHQPVHVPVAQHGSLDDTVYFTASGKAANKGNKKRRG